MQIGRPQKYPLTRRQVLMAIKRLEKGMSVREVARELVVHSFAVLRVKRGMDKV